MDLMKKIVELKDIERKEYQKATNDRDKNYAHGALLAYIKIGQILENACDGKTSEREQANEILPLVKCFKTHGEKIIKELGFEIDYKYNHDYFHTNRYRKGLLMVEFTYDGFTLKTVDLTMDEVFCKPITYAELQALTSILHEKLEIEMRELVNKNAVLQSVSGWLLFSDSKPTRMQRIMYEGNCGEVEAFYLYDNNDGTGTVNLDHGGTDIFERWQAYH